MVELLKLAVRRFRSEDDYRAMQAHVAEATVAELRARGIELPQCDVLELGAGRGGYSVILDRWSRSLTASDFERDPFFDDAGIPFEIVDVTQPFPFESERFDLIYCSSVIEHVEDTRRLLEESRRVLRPGGYLLLSFPPFYSLAMVGGHMFKPFHFLGETLAVRLTNLVRGREISDYRTAFGSFGLYPLTIDEVARRLHEAGFEIRDAYTRMSRVNTARLPGRLKDLLTWHVCFLARSPGAHLDSNTAKPGPS
jgi:SAM-dependent methyltransferase